LQYQHQTIDELIRGYDEESLKKRVFPDKWSPFENIVHLVSYQLIFKQRIDKMLDGGHPSFSRYVAEDDPGFYAWLEQPLKELLHSLYNVRSEIYQQLTHLSTDQLSSVGHHPKYGALTLIQWSEFFLLHEAHHQFTLFKLLNENG
jgi:DinB superfamily